jgi:hypothetical protein
MPSSDPPLGTATAPDAGVPARPPSPTSSKIKNEFVTVWGLQKNRTPVIWQVPKEWYFKNGLREEFGVVETPQWILCTPFFKAIVDDGITPKYDNLKDFFEKSVMSSDGADELEAKAQMYMEIAGKRQKKKPMKLKDVKAVMKAPKHKKAMRAVWTPKIKKLTMKAK